MLNGLLGKVYNSYEKMVNFSRHIETIKTNPVEIRNSKSEINILLGLITE